MKRRADYDKVFETLKNIIKGTKYENHVFTVGGCERDRIIGGIVKDIDIVLDVPNGGVVFAHCRNHSRSGGCDKNAKHYVYGAYYSGLVLCMDKA